MQKVTYAASSAADTVSKAILGDSTHRDGTVTSSETGHTQRAGDTSKITGDSVASDYPRDESSTGKYQINSPSTPMRHTGGTQSSTFETGSEFSSGPSDTYVPKAGLTGTTGDFSSSQTSGSTSTNARPHQSNVANKLDPRADSDRDHCDATPTTSYSNGTRSGTSTNPYHNTPDSDDVGSVDASKSPTHTEISTNTATGHSSPFQGIPTSGCPDESSSSTGLTSQAGNDTSARKSTVGGSGSDAPSTLTGSEAGGPGAQATPSVGTDPPSGNNPHQKHQDTSRPMDEPSTSSDPRSGLGGVGHRKSVPLIEGHPESSGPKTHSSSEKLPSGPGTGEGTGTQYVRSSGVVADGGDFDASAPGAGREADRLLDDGGVHHGADVKNKTHSTKPSIGERIKEKLHKH